MVGQVMTLFLLPSLLRERRKGARATVSLAKTPRESEARALDGVLRAPPHRGRANTYRRRGEGGYKGDEFMRWGARPGRLTGGRVQHDELHCRRGRLVPQIALGNEVVRDQSHPIRGDGSGD
ncbi:hypothetical protein K402DRAFT_43699 [Aulographum hederae CBS 113979]|uniref:Uncharacterized protein n=1 Tax=Aulographum hederae CBS 113979 TaxID=1176131 RepID=A0A6G1H3Q4_9PEZI|nr:hypothetical protein K402DRAFT_43699 [Aulographum hederae CBS 113979]